MGRRFLLLLLVLLLACGCQQEPELSDLPKLELLREGVADGSVQTQYPQELAQLLPLIDFWLLPSVFPASPEEIRHRYRFVVQALAAMGLPLLPEAFPPLGEEILSALPAAEGGEER